MFKSYYDVREWVENFIPLVYGREELGLERIQHLLKLFGNPERKFKSIHIAGTAGKGSTAYYTARLLQYSKSEILNPKSETNSKLQYPNPKKVSNLGFRALNFPTKVGLHVSPHLVDIRERMRIFQYPISPPTLKLWRAGNIPRLAKASLGEQYQISNTGLIPAKRFLRLFNEIKPVVESMKSSPVGEPSYFEILVAASFKYFAEEKVDYAVVEVGLGGRLDATNVLKPEIAVITNVGLDHTELLGETVEEIAKEKAGIIKKGIPVVTAAGGKAFRVIEKVAKEKGSKVIKVNTQKLPYGLSFQSFSDAPFLAVEVLKQLKMLLKKSTVEKVFSETFAGRFEVRQLADDQDVILDGAHNPDKIKALINFVGKFEIRNSKSETNSKSQIRNSKQVTLVLAFKKGKAWKEMADMLIRNLPVSRVIATSFYATTDTGKFSAVSPREISDYLNSRYKIPDTRYYDNSQEAVMEAINANSKQLTANSSKQIVLVTGSLYFVGEVRTMWMLSEF